MGGKKEHRCQKVITICIYCQAVQCICLTQNATGKLHSLKNFIVHDHFDNCIYEKQTQINKWAWLKICRELSERQVLIMQACAVMCSCICLFYQVGYRRKFHIKETSRKVGLNSCRNWVKKRTKG